jgi:hypothetical protein
MTAFKPGDKIAFSGFCLESAIICLATYGLPYLGRYWPRWCTSISHIGVVGEYKDDLYIFESTTHDDCSDVCAIRRVPCDGVQAHEIEDRIEKYNGRVWHYPLTTALYSHEVVRSTEFLVSCLGRSYDEPGAIRSGMMGSTYLLGFLEEQLGDESLEWLFCSEFVAAHDTTVGIFKTTNASGWSPNRLIRKQRHISLLRKPIILK